MSVEITITPQIEPDHISLLDKQVKQLDYLLDNPHSGPKPIAQTGILEQIGSLLWEASGLQADGLLDALEQARDDEKPVRLIVAGEAFHHLPWELLYSPHEKLGFVARHPWCVLARRLQGKGQKSPTLLPRPFRILLFIASPEDLDAERSRLDFEKEEELLFTALDEPLSKGELDIDVAEDGCLNTLLDRLKRHQYHAIILSLHGTRAVKDNGKKEWGLLFEDEHTGRSAPVAGSDLATQLDRLPSGHRPGLVVLSACRSAKAEESADSITSVATQLHEGGFERVLGMRLVVLDSAASAFNAQLFPLLAQGEAVGRAVTLARDSVGQGGWLSSGETPAKGLAVGDVFAQWTLPVLFDRTADGPLVDINAPVQIEQRPALPTVLAGDGSIHLPTRDTFVGRRAFIRQYLRPFLEGKTRGLMLTGPGGVGKTALAGLFARRLSERQADIRILGFRAPFELDMLYEPLRREACDNNEDPALVGRIQIETDRKEQIRLILQSLAQRKRPCAFVLDNLESLQELETLETSAEYADSLWLLQTVCALPAPTRLVLTGRYPFSELSKEVVQQSPVLDAPYGDVLRRMRGLDWPAEMTSAEKREVYTVLGGNHRAIEWTAQLLTNQQQKSHELLGALAQLEAPPETPRTAVDVVAEAMRQNLLFDRLREQLTPVQDRLLRTACLYRVPVNADGLLALEPQADQAEHNCERLVTYALLEQATDPVFQLDYFVVPPIVQELLGEPSFEAVERQALHRAMGQHHRFQGQYVSKRWSDDIEAIYHFRQAEEHVDADQLAERVCGFYYRISNYADASLLTAEIVDRDIPPAPWWALNRYGMCQLTLGFPAGARQLSSKHSLSPQTRKKKAPPSITSVRSMAHGAITTPPCAISNRVSKSAATLAIKPAKAPPSITSVRSIKHGAITTPPCAISNRVSPSTATLAIKPAKAPPSITSVRSIKHGGITTPPCAISNRVSKSSATLAIKPAKAPPSITSVRPLTHGGITTPPCAISNRVSKSNATLAIKPAKAPPSITSVRSMAHGAITTPPCAISNRVSKSNATLAIKPA